MSSPKLPLLPCDGSLLERASADLHVLLALSAAWNPGILGPEWSLRKEEVYDWL